MDSHDIANVAFAAIIVGIPLLGITARLVLKPVVDALIRLREAGMISGVAQQQQVLADRRLTDMQEEIHNLQQSMRRLVEAEAFNRQLGAGEKRAPLPPAGDAIRNEAQ
jgi:hypothetical protein